VNIHPAKREVKLFDQRYIDSLILAVAEKALNREHALSPGAFTGPETASGAHTGAAPGPQGDPGSPSLWPEGITAPASGPSLAIRDMGGLYGETSPRSERILGVVFDTYVVVQDGDLLRFIDFHAAHERMIFDALMARERQPDTQELLFPRVVELSLDDRHTVMENLDAFIKIGFDMEEFSDTSIIIRGVPTLVRDADCDGIVADFVESMKSGRDDSEGVAKKAAALAACHGAKRAGDDLSGDDIAALLELVSRKDADLRCPHGRPFVYVLGKSDLERLFKRS
jgi:DNA mismatch repair protein MutL